MGWSKFIQHLMRSIGAYFQEASVLVLVFGMLDRFDGLLPRDPWALPLILGTSGICFVGGTMLEWWGTDK